MARYLISRSGDTRTVTAYIDGETYITNDLNPNFDKITEALFEDRTEGLPGLFTSEIMVREQFTSLSERVSVSNGQVYFDGDPIENTLSDHLLRLIHDGQNVSCLVNFWENIAGNQSTHSREHLLRWLTAEDFSITDNGFIVGYKGLRADLTSVHSGPGIVNGVSVVGNLDNTAGNIVEIPRSKVTANSAVGCASGLHVGTWEYASSFGARVIEVRVNPRDVVSVPVDCNGEKMRVCRYTAGPEVSAKHTTAVVSDYNDDDDFDYDESDDWMVL